MSFFGNNTTAVPAAAKDIEIADPPSDSVSSIAFSNQADFLAVASWDNNVRLYEVAQGGQTQGKAMYSHQAPVLSVCWSTDGTKVFSGGADNAGRMFDTTTGASSQVAQHDAPIKAVRWIDAQGGILVTGSWDKTVKYWDLRSPTPLATVPIGERCYSMDANFPLMVVATGSADRMIQIFNLNNPNTPYKSIPSSLKWQTRVVSCFASVSHPPGFAVGSTEGRVGIQYIEDNDTPNNFSFKCHRRDSAPNNKDQALVYAVNDISFHPTQGTFSTAGADGSIYFWDKDARTRLKTFEPSPAAISATAFNRTGNIFAYAVSYDWSKGHMGMPPNHQVKLMLHACTEEEVKKRAKK